MSTSPAMPSRKPRKGPRGALVGGAPRLLGRHDGREGAAYHRAYVALQADLGPFSPLSRLEAGRVAVAWVQLEATTRALVDAQRLRRLGRGRRPSAAAVERLARRQGLADNSYAQALERLRQLTSTKRRSLASLVGGASTR